MPNDVKREHVVTVTLTGKEHQALQRVAKGEDRSMAHIVRRAIAAYIARGAAK